MSERADYYIEKVQYTKDHNRIIRVSVREDSGTKLSKPHDMARKEIIELLQNGKHFMTIYRNDEGKYRKGQKIVMVQVNGVDYIHTNPSQNQNDHLENLPEY
jgi:hypothetical protein